jgi:hypothetical protein
MMTTEFDGSYVEFSEKNSTTFTLSNQWLAHSRRWPSDHSTATCWITAFKMGPASKSPRKYGD